MNNFHVLKTMVKNNELTIENFTITTNDIDYEMKIITEENGFCSISWMTYKHQIRYTSVDYNNLSNSIVLVVSLLGEE